MEKLEYGMVGKHVGSEQVGKVTRVYKGGQLGLFRTNTGAQFTVNAGEIETLDWEPDALEALANECLAELHHEVKYVYVDRRYG